MSSPRATDDKKKEGGGKKSSFTKTFRNRLTQITTSIMSSDRPHTPPRHSQAGAPARAPTEEDEIVTIMKKVYFLSKSPCMNYFHNTGNCRNNPKCLKGLGEYSRGIWKADAELSKDPVQSIRDPTIPYIGFRNLGATCYINSLLQTLFMNRRFRQAIYRYEGDDKLCHLLQLLFAQLQVSQKSSCTPKEITTFLNIETSVQQDVQEFNSLFLNLLEKTLKKSAIPEVSSFIKTEFRGVEQYQTKCKNCGRVSSRESKNSELVLSIDGHKTLGSCLRALTKEETMSGDNKYDCDYCGLVDAVRRFCLVTLPPMLNIQLLRFVYDAHTGTKKKLSTPVTFPRTLDMKPYVENTRGETLYELTAVLLHLGSNANHGHYIAHIQDEVTHQWWKFDDTRVTPLELKEVGDIEPQVSSDDHGLLDKGTREQAKKLLSSLKGNAKITSQNAYMLVYSRKNREPLPDTPMPPPDALQQVEKANAIILKKREDWKEQKEEVSSAVTHHKDLYKEFMELAPPAPKATYHWIDAEWLSEWIKGEANGPPDNSDVLCEHGKADPRKIYRMKVISTKAWEFLTALYDGRGGPELTGLSCCADCSVKIHNNTVRAQDKQNEIRTMIRKAFASNGYQALEGYWVPDLWLQEWRKQAPINQLDRLDPLINRSITCEHGELMWKKSGRRLVSTEVWSYLRDQFPEGPEYHKDAPPCQVCREIGELRLIEIRNRRTERSHQKLSLGSLSRSVPVDSLSNGVYYAVPTYWQKLWYLYVSRSDIDDLDKLDTSILLCEHGGLKYNPMETRSYCVNPSLPMKLMPESEWVQLVEFYGPVENPIRIELQKSKNEVQLGTDPLVCEACLATQEIKDLERKMAFVSTKVWVEVPMTTSTFSAISTFAGHQSRPKLQRFPLMINIDDTIHVIKLKIMQSTNIQPVKQQLVYRGDVLDNAKTVFDYLIVPGARITLNKLKESEAPEYVDGDTNTVTPPAFEEIPPEVLRAQPTTVIEEGFRGSLLYGGNEEERKDEDAEWQCPECTMINTGTSCAVCDLPNPAIFGDGASFSEEEAPELWECKHCRVPNEMTAKRCIACERYR